MVKERRAIHSRSGGFKMLQTHVSPRSSFFSVTVDSTVTLKKFRYSIRGFANRLTTFRTWQLSVRSENPRIGA